MAEKSTERKAAIKVVVHKPETRTVQVIHHEGPEPEPVTVEVNVVDEDGNPVDPETLARVIGGPS